ncbi:MAG: hypothetical protein WAQ25_02550 [Candidatus Saccharimonas sp.]
MYKGSGPRIFPILVVIIVIALVIAALVSVGRMVFTSTGSSTTNNESTDAVLSSLHDTADSRSVRWTVRGPIVADEKFMSYQITVSPKKRTVTIYNGYLETVTSTRSYINNTKAYEQFVYALEKANIGKTRTANGVDFRGVCATHGLAFQYESLRDDTADHTLWTTTCTGSKGTMAANTAQVHALFVNQIPDFSPQFDEIY